MKKSIIFLGAAALVMLAACNKEVSLQVEPKGLSLDATVEQQVDPNATKTALDGTSVVWAADDAIKVFDEAGKAVKLTADAAGTSAHFTQVGDTPDGFNEAGDLYAIYPHDAATGVSGSTITFTLPATQTYVADSFDPACNVSVGEVVSNTATFHNAFGLLKLQLKGIMKVGKIELTSKTASQYLSGTFTVDASAGSAAVYSTGGSTTLTLDCDDEGGVQLDAETATDFYFVVPVGSFAAGFTATVYDVASYSDSKYSIDVVTTSDNTIARSKIRTMPTICASLIPANYSEITYLESPGAQYVSTGITPGLDHSIEIEFQWIAGMGILGCRGLSASDNAFTINVHSTSKMGGSFGSGVSNIGSVVATTNTRYIVTLSKTALVVNGVSSPRNAESLTGQGPILLFAFTSNKGSGNEISYYSHIKLYRNLIWDGSDLVSYLVPAVRTSDSVLGLYDVVSGDFLENLGSGSFTSGGALDVDRTFQKPAV